MQHIPTTFTLVKGESTCQTMSLNVVKKLKELGWVIKVSKLGELL